MVCLLPSSDLYLLMSLRKYWTVVFSCLLCSSVLMYLKVCEWYIPKFVLDFKRKDVCVVILIQF